MFRVWNLWEENHLQSLLAFLASNWKACSDKQKPLVIHVMTGASKRSLQFNAFYWAAILKQISEQAWVDGVQYPSRAWHEEFRNRFAPRIDTPFGGSHPMSTSDMSVEQFLAYIHEIEVFAAETLGVQFLEWDDPYQWRPEPKRR